jgi:hypothetical protein
MATREAVLGLDDFEYKLSMTLGGIAIVLGLFFFAQWVRNATIVKTAKPLAHSACVSGYHYIASSSLCQQTLHDKGEWLLQFSVVLVVGLALFYTAWRRKRAGVATFSLLIGLYLGIFGLGVVFFFYGAWLMLRAYRLQRYGDATWKGSNRIAKEMAAARRAGTDYRPALADGDTTVAPVSAPRTATPPPPSKRYTPKKQSRRR